MSSVITIGFVGRTRTCLRTEFAPPLADDERREILIHVALLTARTFAAVPPERQTNFAGALKEWIEDRFIACPTRPVLADPLSCLPRFASSFVALGREYALATKGCNDNGAGLEFFLPLATASFLRHVAVTYENPEELLKPALALCAATMIHPITPATHFQAAAASLPKIAPVVEKPAGEVEERPRVVPLSAQERSLRDRVTQHRRSRRRSLIVSASLAALLIILGVQYLSTRLPRQEEPVRPSVPGAPARPAPPAPPMQPVPATPQIPEPQTPPARIPETPLPSLPAAPPEESRPVVPQEPVRTVTSQQVRDYQVKVWEFAEDAVAHVEVMMSALRGRILKEYRLAETLDYGRRQVENLIHRVSKSIPPSGLEEKHEKLVLVFSELGGLAEELRTPRPSEVSPSRTERLHEIQVRLEEALRALDNP